MADSDYSIDGTDVSDDEYVGPKVSASSNTRTQSVATGKRRTQAPAPAPAKKKQAWEPATAEEAEGAHEIEEDDGEEVEEVEKSIQEREEERKRKRLRKDTKPFQRGIIRHVVLVLDLSETMYERDMRPNRYHAMINYTQEYVREFFEQNPISQMSVLVMHDGLCHRLTELSGNPAEHVAAIKHIKKPENPETEVAKEPKGSPSLQNALELARAMLYHTPSHGTREVIIVFGSLISLDPGDIHQTIKSCVRDRIRVSIVGMSARLKICQEIVARTNAGDESEYVIATDQEALRELLLATTTPPVVRSTEDTTAIPAESAAALMMMGFPSRVVEDVPTMCACHGNLTTGGYTCSRCSAKVCSLPVTCPSCQLTLLLSTHLARSYHHLFPLRNWVEVSWERARQKASIECVSCLSAFPPIPEEDITDEDMLDAEKEIGKGEKEKARQKRMEKEDSEEQKASESARYECRACESHFCIDCDMFCHLVLHNCPGCLSRLNPVAAVEGQENGNGDVIMTG